MDVGLMMIFASYGWDGISDRQGWDEDLRLAKQAPALGFDGSVRRRTGPSSHTWEGDEP